VEKGLNIGLTLGSAIVTVLQLDEYYFKHLQQKYPLLDWEAILIYRIWIFYNSEDSTLQG
jgi:hypothetical protein